IGPVFSSTALKVARDVTIPAGALMLNPFSVSPLLTTLKESGLVWRTATSYAAEPAGMALLVEQLERDVRAMLMLKDADKIRLGTAEMVTRVVARIEAAWPGGPMGPPIYVMSEGMKLTELRQLAGASTRGLGRRTRLFAPRVNRALYSAFEQRWFARFAAALPD